MLFQSPYQGVAKRGKMRSLYSKSRVLTTRMADDGLEYLALIERPNDGGDISLSCCRSISSGNNRCASGASSKNRL
jgi:hypothetical protein